MKKYVIRIEIKGDKWIYVVYRGISGERLSANYYKHEEANKAKPINAKVKRYGYMTERNARKGADSWREFFDKREHNTTITVEEYNY